MTTSFDLLISSYNEVHSRVTCKDEGIARELVEYFTFQVPNARFVPAFKNKVWDGKIRLYNMYNQLLYCGLLSYVARFAEDRNYSVGFSQNFSTTPKNTFTNQKTVDFIESLNIHSKGIKLTPQPHQVEGIKHTINNEKCLLLSPTASGKSFVIYSLMRYFQQRTTNKKILIVVPTVSLVNQMYSDFADYASETTWDAESNCHLIFSGQEKNQNKPVVITTWQSCIKNKKEYFAQFGAVFIDEAHGLVSASLVAIMEKLVDCPVRIGLTGTLDGMKTNKLVVEGLTGKVHRLAYTKDLMDAKLLTKLKISCLMLEYPDVERKACKNLKYSEEIDFLISHPRRNEFIADLAISTKGNTLVLYQFVEKHGKVLHEIITNKLSGSNRKIFFISGDVEAEIRENIRKITETETDAILICSNGTFAVGINIKRLHNIVFASPSKGRIRVLQSIGRQLRLAGDKEVARLYDISDNLSWKSHQNYSFKHLIERLKIYNEEQFDFKIHKTNI